MGDGQHSSPTCLGSTKVARTSAKFGDGDWSEAHGDRAGDLGRVERVQLGEESRQVRGVGAGTRARHPDVQHLLVGAARPQRWECLCFLEGEMVEVVVKAARAR